MLETFCIDLAFGLALAPIILPHGSVSPRFYRIQSLIVLGLAVTSVTAAWLAADTWFWLSLVLAAGAILLGFIRWRRELTRRELLAGVVVFVLPLIAGLVAAVCGRPGVAFLLSRSFPYSAFLLGTATTAMLMGHWYLISPTMSLQPLQRLLVAFFVALGLRAATAGAELWFWQGGISSDPTAIVWLLLRWGVGLVGPAVLGWMAWQSARIRSTQSATGILYVVVIFTFIGELTAQLLQSHLLTNLADIR